MSAGSGSPEGGSAAWLRAGRGRPAPEWRPWSVRLLAGDDFPALRTLHHTILEELPPRLVARETDTFLERNLGLTGETFGCEVEGHLIAYGILNLGGPEHETIASGLGLAPALARTMAVLDGVGVHPDHRGCGLHRLLTRNRIDRGRRTGRRLFTASVAPANLPSLRNLLAEGFEIAAMQRMFGGHWRYLMVGSGCRRAESDEGAIVCTVDDAVRQQTLLGAGYVGTSVDVSNQGVIVGFVRRRPGGQDP